MSSFATDVLLTQPLTGTGQFTTQGSENITFRTRVKGVHIICGASAGSLVIRDGGASGSVLATINTPTAANAGYVFMFFPAQGVLAQSGLHGTLTNVTSATLFYG